MENRYRLNGDHYLVAHGLRALFEGERHMPGAIAKELGSLLDGKVMAAGLFGSYARGAARAGSDIDLFVVVQTLKISPSNTANRLPVPDRQEYRDRGTPPGSSTGDP